MWRVCSSKSYESQCFGARNVVVTEHKSFELGMCTQTRLFIYVTESVEKGKTCNNQLKTLNHQNEEKERLFKNQNFSELRA